MVCFSRGKPGDKVPQSLQAQATPPSSLFMAPWRLFSPFVLPNKLTPDFQVSLGLGKHVSRLVPHLVFVFSAEIWTLCTVKLCPQGLAGVLTLCGPDPTYRCTKVGFSRSTRSPASSILPEMQPLPFRMAFPSPGQELRPACLCACFGRERRGACEDSRFRKGDWV